jgi:hypothetical protein
MISKKQRKSSRFYNCVLKRAQTHPIARRVHKLRRKLKIEAPNLALIRVPPANRESQTPRQRMSFIPRVAALFSSLFRKAA